MRKYSKLYRWMVGVAAITFLSIGLNDQTFAQSESEAYGYTRVYTDENGISHYDDIPVPFEIRNFAPPAGPIGVSESMNAKSVLFINLPFGWDGDWHPTPRKQFAIFISGTQVVSTSDGEVRTFGPGDVVLLEDTTGKGHAVKVTSPNGSIAMMVPLTSE
jgi:murein DD-endopeptidase MepM/ murein hydrolase activator NlpD